MQVKTSSLRPVQSQVERIQMKKGSRTNSNGIVREHNLNRLTKDPF